jgi:hypothetical protein
MPMTKEHRKLRAKVRRQGNRLDVARIYRLVQHEIGMSLVKSGEGDNALWGSPIRIQDNMTLARLAHLGDQIAIIGTAAHRELERRYRETKKARRALENRMKYNSQPEADHLRIVRANRQKRLLDAKVQGKLA